MSSGRRCGADAMADIRRKARATPFVMVVSLAGVVCSCLACFSIRYVAEGGLPEARLNIVFLLVLLAAAVAGALFAWSMRRLLWRTLRLVSKVVEEKDVLVQNVLHDLKSPLASISSHAQLMKVGVREVGEGCDGILSSCDRLVKTINDNIEITNNYMGKGDGTVGQVEVNGLVGDVVDEFRDAARTKGVKLLYSHARNELRAAVSGAKIESLVRNLVENAVKYTPGGGEVDVSVSSVSGGFKLRVSDTGCGMSSEVQSHMYERFYRADPSCAEKGVGLGLAMVESVVELYGGTVECVSSPGKGATFVVSIPVRR